MSISPETQQYLIELVQEYYQNNPIKEHQAAEVNRQDIEQFVKDFVLAYETPEKMSILIQAIAESLYQKDEPYVFVIGLLNVLKKGLLEDYVKNDASAYEKTANLDRFFECAKDDIAYVYLTHRIQKNHIVPVNKLQHKALISIYNDWFHLFQRVVLQKDMSLFEDSVRLQKKFKEVLLYPESIIVCLDIDACHEVFRIHQGITEQSRLFFTKWKTGNYLQAYILYNEFQVQIKQLISLLMTLYFNYETDPMGAFFRFLNSAPSMDRQAYLTVINVLNLNRINQLEGVEVGDGLLKQVELKIEQLCVQNPEYFSYAKGISGDFYIVSIKQTSSKLKAYFDQMIDGLDASVGIGSAHLNHLKSQDPDVLRRLAMKLHRHDAEIVLHDSKDQVQTIESEILKDVRLSIDLKKALSSQNIDIALQPIVHLTAPGKKDSFLGFEVLGRIQTESGLVSAGVFIDQLVNMKLTDQFDILILQKVCEYASQIKKFSQTLFINVSPASLNNPKYAALLQSALANQLEGLNVVLELTEQTLLDEEALVREIAQKYQVTFAIDDFGSGYSSLITVIELARSGIIGYLKIDGSLTQKLLENEETGYIFQVISEMAGTLKLLSVAEFIENDAVYNSLFDHAITYGQGYFLGRPNTVEYWEIECIEGYC